ncbi:EAL domain-containing protein [Methylobacterium sp. E-005]|uniref:bifunctional diguanylate cyclase/phosphodiesterase n=1 Tax=Methylobacterium sp. E-005 TaxID=2836549 RepID=UPI001FB913AD|nr:EAL domain-containing protein [Methylobacterium sp. E-005]MCJ2085151.1 EAL domain-containing protein [Methylobacterium sp. E-005]
MPNLPSVSSELISDLIPSDVHGDPQLDAICRTATALFGTRYAFVSCLDAECQRILAHQGLEVFTTPRPVAFCAATILGVAYQPLIVPDTHEDPRFAVNPLVIGEPFLRFYAGVPIALGDGADGAAVCIADTAPRQGFGTDERRQLHDLAMLVEAILRGRRAQNETKLALQQAEEASASLRAEIDRRNRSEALAVHQQTLLEEAHEVERFAEEAAGFGRWTIQPAHGTVIWSNGMAQLLGREDLAERVLDLEQHIACYHPSEREEIRKAIPQADDKADGPAGGFIRRGRILRPDGEVRDVVVHGRTTRDATSGAVTASGITLDVTDLMRSEDRLHASEALLGMTLEHMDQGLIMTDADDRVRVCNRRVAKLLGIPEELLQDGMPFDRVRIYQRDQGEFSHLPDHLRHWLEHGDPEGCVPDYERTRPNGTVLQVRTLPLPGGGMVRTFTDMTAYRAAEASEQESERRFRLLAANASDVLILGSLNISRTYVSAASIEVLGYEPKELIGTSPINMIHSDDIDVFNENWSQLLSGENRRPTFCIRHRHKDGSYIWIETSASLLYDEHKTQPNGYVAVLRDVTARREAEERIRHMALHDTLTGLPNRALFRDRLDQAIAHAAHTHSPFAVLTCDLDRFKAINDSLGHPAGDVLLRVVAERMQSVLRPYDTVARLGGDEFAIVLTYLDEQPAASSLAERLIAAVGEPIILDGQAVEVGVSVGITVALENDGDADELFKRADMALYEAKAGGRNTYRIFCPDVGARIAMRGQLGLDMKDAIRRGEFRLVYQPVVDATTGNVVSLEALMRWSHPARGEISPGEFIPLAEENGLIVPLGAWALREACREALSWPEPLRVGVNVSAVQFRSELEEAVLVALAETGLPAHRLKLEVTESVLMQDGDAVIACLHRLRALGIVIALDDFGTGYSSLGYLRRFPFDKIKIDRSFIRDITDPDAAAIVRAVVNIGERLGMGIVAEGVETAEQLELVCREGCTQVQGFLFSRPLPPQDALAYVLASQVGSVSASPAPSNSPPKRRRKASALLSPACATSRTPKVA